MCLFLIILIKFKVRDRCLTTRNTCKKKAICKKKHTNMKRIMIVIGTKNHSTEIHLKIKHMMCFNLTKS